MRRPGLRARVIAVFAGGALVLSAAVSTLSFGFTRQSLLNERERTAIRTTYFDATVVQSGLSADGADVVNLLRALDTGAVRKPVIRRDGTWFARQADSGVTVAVPLGLQTMVESGRPGVQLVRTDNGPALVLGIPLSVTTQFYEVHSLQELDQTLRVIAVILVLAAAGTAIGGAGLGWYATGLVLRPVARVTQAARDIAGGDLDSRLDPAVEPELRQLTFSFNDMVDQLSQRMQRDRRFAADVSHELRSPLQTLSAAAAVLIRRRDRLDDRTAAAAELVADELSRFRNLVTDLLELSRGDQRPQSSDVDVAALARQVCRARGVRPGVVHAVGDTVWWVDRRRLAQVPGNLVENANRYGGGPIAIRLRQAHGMRVIEVDDDGPGVLPEEREIIFQPFVRGRGAVARADGDGTGLGLPLVASHVDVHGGRVMVTDRPGGGARFRVELPVTGE